jgi:hypothetical protein
MGLGTFGHRQRAKSRVILFSSIGEEATMHIFIIDAYGGPGRTDGVIRHFTVQAESAEEAVEIVRGSPRGQSFQRFEIVSETPAFEPDQPSIIEESDGPYLSEA